VIASLRAVVVVNPTLTLGAVREAIVNRKEQDAGNPSYWCKNALTNRRQFGLLPVPVRTIGRSSAA
jgi:hypothetical protein